MNLNHVIDQVSRDKGIDREILVETLEAAILTAAKRTFGAQREIEAQFDEDKGQVELFQIITVVGEEDVENPFREITVSEAERYSLDADPGDELLFQIFYRDEDKDEAERQDKRYGNILKLQSSRATFGRIAAQIVK
jgi:N utilization substance protein A